MKRIENKESTDDMGLKSDMGKYEVNANSTRYFAKEKDAINAFVLALTMKEKVYYSDELEELCEKIKACLHESEEAYWHTDGIMSIHKIY